LIYCRIFFKVKQNQNDMHCSFVGLIVISVSRAFSVGPSFLILMNIIETRNIALFNRSNEGRIAYSTEENIDSRNRVLKMNFN
jgi:hypothetical protein